MKGMSRWGFPLVAALTLIVVFLTLSCGSASAAKIYGIVTDGNGARLAGATVTLYQNGSIYALAPDNPFTTDSAGYYEFPSLPPGTFSVQADKGGYPSSAEMRELGGIDVGVDLRIMGYSAGTATPTLPPVYTTPTPTPPPPTPTPAPRPSNTPVPLPTAPPQPGFELLLALVALLGAAAFKRSG